jgi:hypothetical protein
MTFPPLINILFLDIETVPQYAHYAQLPDGWKQLWDTKSNSLIKYHEGETNETLYPRAGIYAEFGKIVCISCGIVQETPTSEKLLSKALPAMMKKTASGFY